MARASGTVQRIGIVSGDPLRVEGLKAILEAAYQVLSLTAPDSHPDTACDILFVDAPEDDLMATMAAFRRVRPRARILVLGIRRELAFVQKVVAAGAKGYLLYTAEPREILQAIDVVNDGSIWASRKVLSNLIDTFSETESRAAHVRLTPREQQVIELLIAGRANREIAATLGVEVKTVKSHVGHLLQKFGVPNRVALAMRALEALAAPAGIAQIGKARQGP